VSRRVTLKHEFVEYIPQSLEEGTIYISMPFATAVHRCCCGCGQEVVTPLSPTDWALIFDGETVSLDPSVGNWGFKCESHYWIRRNCVEWAERWTPRQIADGRDRDRWRKTSQIDHDPSSIRHRPSRESEAGELEHRLFWRVWRWFTRG